MNGREQRLELRGAALRDLDVTRAEQRIGAEQRRELAREERVAREEPEVADEHAMERADVGAARAAPDRVRLGVHALEGVADDLFLVRRSGSRGCRG